MLARFAQTYTTTDVSNGFWAFSGGFLLLALALWIVSIVALWKVFEKAGIPGWKSIIPIYNAWLLFEMAGKPGWWALVSIAMVIPFLNFFVGIVVIILYCIAALEIGKAFGKSQAFSIVALIIFSFVGLLILGFDESKYTKPASAPAKFS